MVNVSHDPELRAYVTGYLLEGFERLGMEEVQIHIADNYLDESCESDIVELILARMEGFRNMQVGETAPDFVIRDRSGKNIRLSGLTNPYTLVLFWASTCEHCQEMLPRLHDWYTGENFMDMEIVAISIDTAVSHFEIFMDLLEPQWISSHDPLGWHGKVPSAYHIYATPALFLLNRERIILSRPTNFRQFTRAVKKLEP
jgi:peroxiredoxin